MMARRGVKTVRGGTALSVLVADEQALFRAGLARLLTGLGPRVEVVEAAGFAEALQRLAERAFDMVLADFPAEPDGVAGLTKLLRAAGKAPLVVVSARDRAEDVRRATAAGARGHVPKSSSSKLLLSALRLVLAGGLYLPPILLDAPAPRRRAGLSESGAPFGQADALTPRQREVLALLAEGKSNRQIAGALGLSTGTVKIHMTRVFKTLGVQSRTQAVLAAIGRNG